MKIQKYKNTETNINTNLRSFMALPWTTIATATADLSSSIQCASSFDLLMFKEEMNKEVV